MPTATVRVAALLFMSALLVNSYAGEPSSSAPQVLSWTEGAPRPKATIEAMRWLEGTWEGKLEAATQQHIAFAPISGQMPGFVRAWGPDGKLWFYEIAVLVEVDGSLEFRDKHFSPELAGWEEKDAFVRRRLVAMTDQALYFDGITFIKEGPNHHTVYVRIPSGERKGEIVVVHQTRVTGMPRAR
jgi:hypothetical protein